MYKYTQRSFVGGRLDAELMGRQDLQKYFQGASELVNFTVRRQGYLSKRRGTEFVATLDGLENPGKARIIPLVFETGEGYYLVFSGGRIYIASRSGVLGEDRAWHKDFRSAYSIASYADDESVQGMDYYQSGDALFIVSHGFPPARVDFYRHRIDSGEPLNLSSAFMSVDVQAAPTVNAVAVDCAFREWQYRFYPTRRSDGRKYPIVNKSFTLYDWPDDGSITFSLDTGYSYEIYKMGPYDEGMWSFMDNVFGLASWTDHKFITDPNGSPQPPATWGSGTAPIIGHTLNNIKASNDASFNAKARYYMAIGRDEFAPKTLQSTVKTISVRPFRDELDYVNLTFTAAGTYGLVDIYYSSDRSNWVLLEEKHDITAPFEDRVNTPTGSTEVNLAGNIISPAPRITDVRQSWAEHSGDHQHNKASYKVSRVEVDGTESYASAPVEKRYCAPWPADGYITVSIAAPVAGIGAPKKYRVYKSTGVVGFGFIGEVDGASGEVCFDDNYITPDYTQTPIEKDSQKDFASEGNRPSTVSIYQQRLVFANTEREPFTFWMSRTGNFTDFSVHDYIIDSDGLEAALSAEEFPRINHVVFCRDLLMFTDGGEWKISPVSGNSLSYKTVSSSLQSAHGCIGDIKPMSISDEVVFLKRDGGTLIATRYNYTSDGYETKDLSVLSQWIFKDNPVKSMAYRQHPDSVVECVLENGELAMLVYMKEHDVCAWSRAKFGGGWLAKAVASNKAISRGSSEVMYLVERDGEYRLWRERDDVPVRERGSVDAVDHVCVDGMRELAEGEAAAGGETGFTLGGRRFAGYPFRAELMTVRPEVQGASTVQFELKNAKDVEIRILDSGGYRVRSATVPERGATEVATAARVDVDGRMHLDTGDHRTLLLGDNSGDGRVVVTSDGIEPLNILSVSVDYEIQPLSNSEG